VRALLDINVWIALFDPSHVFHERAHSWWSTNSKRGWASCPLTENGVVRIMSNPAYSKGTRFSIGDLIQRLRTFVAQSDHEFWADDLSLRSAEIFVTENLHSSQRLTDIYLLALATHRKGRLVTFDQGISIATARKAKPHNLVII
jgi:uncharacterized protein